MRAKIVEFSRDTCFGVVVYDLTPLKFHSTSYHGHGWPRVGEVVELVFNKAGELLSLHEIS